jgi:hypothetical protein
MKRAFLFPHRYKKVGWLLLLPAFTMGLVSLILEWEPDWLDCRVPAIFIDKFSSQFQIVGMVRNNILNEICGVFLIVGGILTAFSKEKVEDEFITKLRLESLVWATYVNYAILLIAMVVVYDFSFFWVMIFNMFTTLIIFIIRFNWMIVKLKNNLRNEE